DHGLAGREAARIGLRRASLCVAVGPLLRGEHPFAHRRVAPQGALHPFDLADVDPEAEDPPPPRGDPPGPPAPRLLDLTAFGGVRGLVTSQPRSFATWWARSCNGGVT